MLKCNCSTGIRIYFGCRKSIDLAGKNSFSKQILYEFLLVTMKVLNSYIKINNDTNNSYEYREMICWVYLEVSYCFMVGLCL